MTSNIELYEALRPHTGDQGARLIAEAVARPDDVATKSDIQELREDLLVFKAEVRHWMLAFFVPLWIGVYGTLGAIVVSLILRR